MHYNQYQSFLKGDRDKVYRKDIQPPYRRVLSHTLLGHGYKKAEDKKIKYNGLSQKATAREKKAECRLFLRQCLMFFALFRAKMTVFSRQIKLDGAVALTR